MKKTNILECVSTVAILILLFASITFFIVNSINYEKNLERWIATTVHLGNNFNIDYRFSDDVSMYQESITKNYKTYVIRDHTNPAIIFVSVSSTDNKILTIIRQSLY